MIFSWNEFLFASTLTRSQEEKASVTVMEFTGMSGTQWGYPTAAGTIIVAPIIVMVFVLRRRFASGLTFGAVK
jgi:multiple sugar transport system permease protein